MENVLVSGAVLENSFEFAEKVDSETLSFIGSSFASISVVTCSVLGHIVVGDNETD